MSTTLSMWNIPLPHEDPTNKGLTDEEILARDKDYAVSLIRGFNNIGAAAGGAVDSVREYINNHEPSYGSNFAVAESLGSNKPRHVEPFDKHKYRDMLSVDDNRIKQWYSNMYDPTDPMHEVYRQGPLIGTTALATLAGGAPRAGVSLLKSAPTIGRYIYNGAINAMSGIGFDHANDQPIDIAQAGLDFGLGYANRYIPGANRLFQTAKFGNQAYSAYRDREVQ